MRVRIARDELRRIRELTQRSTQLEREITELVAADRAAAAHRARVRTADRGQARRRDRRRPALRDRRPSSPAPPASRRSPPAPATPQRHRLDHGGNRQINAALHRVIVTRARCHPPTRDYIARSRAEGKSTREAIRCLKRYLARHVWQLLQPPHPVQEHRLTHQFLDIEATRGVARSGRWPCMPPGERNEHRADTSAARRSDCRVAWIGQSARRCCLFTGAGAWREPIARWRDTWYSAAAAACDD